MLILYLGFLSCNRDHESSFYDLLNDHLLGMVDTIGYKTGKLIQIPNDSISGVNLESVCILLDTVFQSNRNINTSILAFIQSEKLKEFEYLLAENNKPAIKHVSLGNIHNTGRYILLDQGSKEEAECKHVAGKICFYKPWLDERKAIFAYSISYGEKAGFTNCFLFTRRGEKWVIHRKFEIERW